MNSTLIRRKKSSNEKPRKIRENTISKLKVQLFKIIILCRIQLKNSNVEFSDKKGGLEQSVIGQRVVHVFCFVSDYAECWYS